MFKKIFASFFVLSVLFFFSMKYGQWQGKVRLFKKICHLVHSEFYKASPELDQWAIDCLHRAENDLRLFDSDSLYILIIKDQLSRVDSSHLDLVTPPEGDFIWKGVVKETGLRSRLVDGDYLVVEVLPDSPAEKAGVKKGDIIDKINDQYVNSVDDSRFIEGTYSIRRLHKNLEDKLPQIAKRSVFALEDLLENSESYEAFDVTIELEQINSDKQPHLGHYKNRIGLLEIPHFRESNFDSDSWEQIIKRMSSYRGLIIDLRGNPGGNFVSLLRALSPFFCEPTLIGEIVAPRIKKPSWGEFTNDLEAETQLELVSVYDNISLKTFKNYGCYKLPLRIVVDEETASSAEIFADSLQKLDRAKVLGTSSAGAVVMAMWYNFDEELAPGYKLSVPEKAYRNTKGEALEFKGIELDKVLFYEKKYELLGKDSFLEKAYKSF